VIKKRTKDAEGRMPLKEHLREARNRLFIALAALVLTTIAGAFLSGWVLEYLVSTAKHAGASVNYSSAVSPLDIRIKVSLWIGVVLASPVILYQIWAYIVPGLKKKEKRLSLAFIAASIPLFVGGVALGVLVIPHALRFFFGLTVTDSVFMLQMQEFLSFVIRLTLAFGVAMIIPVMMVGLNLIGILPARLILKHWRITVFVIAVFAAVAAPGGDAMSMVILAGPMLILFALATGLCFLFDKRKAKRLAQNEEDLAANADTAQPLQEL